MTRITVTEARELSGFGRKYQLEVDGKLAFEYYVTWEDIGIYLRKNAYRMPVEFMFLEDSRERLKARLPEGTDI